MRWQPSENRSNPSLGRSHPWMRIWSRMMDQDLAEMRSKQNAQQDEAPDAVPVPHLLVPHLGETAILLDVDGTLLELMPTPREVWVPPGLSRTLNGLVEKTKGALALVSGRSLNDIDLIFSPDQFTAVGGHGAAMRFAG